MIEALEGFPAEIVAFAGTGRVTRRDYEATLIPAVETALKRHGKLRLYYRIGPDFSGMDAGALWQDFKIGIRHLPRWERIAVVTDVEWIRGTVRAFACVMPGEVKVFPLAGAADATAWITAAITP